MKKKIEDILSGVELPENFNIDEIKDIEVELPTETIEKEVIKTDLTDEEFASNFEDRIKSIKTKATEGLVKESEVKTVVKTEFDDGEFEKLYEKQITDVRAAARKGYIKPEDMVIEDTEAYKTILGENTQLKSKTKTFEDNVKTLTDTVETTVDENALLKSSLDPKFAKKARLLAKAEFDQLPDDEELTIDKRVEIYDGIAKEAKWEKSKDFGSKFSKKSKTKEEDNEYKKLLGL